jgi:hypothetical protein
MFGLMRMFGKFANIREIGKLPSDVAKHLKVLGDLNTYKSLRGDKATNSLELLYKASNRKLNLHSIDWLKYPEISVLVSELPKRLKHYSLTSILSIMKSCNKLSIPDEALWKSIEEAIISNMHEVEERQLYDLISCFSKKSNLDLHLWQDLEQIITEKFCPRHNIQAPVLAMIMSTYSRLGLLDDKFLAILEHQVRRVCTNFDGVEVSKVLNIFVHSQIECEETVNKLCKQAKETVYKMDWYSTATTLVSFVRLGKGDSVADIEKCLKLWYDRMDLHLFGNVFFAYAKHMPIALKRNTDRTLFVLDMAEFLQNDGRIWSGEVKDKDLINIMWGLANARAFECVKLWRRLRHGVKDEVALKKDKEFAKVEDILMAAEKSDLINKNFE